MWVKICGVRNTETACGIAPLRPDAIGLNFFQQSPRAVSVETARRIVEILPDEVTPVGLFVGHSIDEINRICRECRLGWIQIHGDEPVEFVRELAARDPRRKIIRAVRLESNLNPMTELIDSCRRLAVDLAAVLIDAAVEGQYGGTGQVAPWKALAAAAQRSDWPPLILAGGLDPGNVAEAIRIVRPWGVDVASGVESSPACKDLSKVAAFIDAARNETTPAAR